MRGSNSPFCFSRSNLLFYGQAQENDMAYFTNQQGYFSLCSDISSEEKRKLNEFLLILEESGVGKIIEEAVGRKPESGGRPSYNPYRLFATLLYAFSRHSGSLRRIEESIRFDTRFMYLMGQEVPSYSTISRFRNNVSCCRAAKNLLVRHVGHSAKIQG